MTPELIGVAIASGIGSLFAVWSVVHFELKPLRQRIEHAHARLDAVGVKA